MPVEHAPTNEPSAAVLPVIDEDATDFLKRFAGFDFIAHHSSLRNERLRKGD
jgi:hypothetical protein